MPLLYVKGRLLGGTVNGQQTGDYTSVILVAVPDDDNTIIEVSSTGEINTTLVPDTYNIVTVNYANDAADCVADVLAEGQPLPSEILGCCVEFSEVYSVIVLPSNDPECFECAADAGILEILNGEFMCEGEELELTLTGNQIEGYGTAIVVVNSADEVVSVGPFPGLIDIEDPDTYIIYVINYTTDIADTVENAVLTYPLVLDNTLCFELYPEQTFTIYPENEGPCFECLAGFEAVPAATYEVCVGLSTEIIEFDDTSIEGYSFAFIISEAGADNIVAAGPVGAIDTDAYNLEAGDYCISPIHYYEEDWDAILDIVDNAGSISELVNAITNTEVCADYHIEECIDLTVLAADSSECAEEVCLAEAGAYIPQVDGYCFAESIDLFLDGNNTDEGFADVLIFDGNVQTSSTINPTGPGDFTAININYALEDSTIIWDILISGGDLVDSLCYAISDTAIITILDPLNIACFDCEATIGDVFYPLDSASLTLCAGSISNYL